jgi:2-oxoglutarate ferredoxin oxidoreductase subunit delta
MSRVEFIDERCKGCLLCTAVCPAGIIVQSNRFNQQGYKVAEVAGADMEKCTGCSACAMICPDYAIRVFKTRKSKAKQSLAAEEQ